MRRDGDNASNIAAEATLMKPRFSIFSLLVVTFYAAIAVAGVVDPLSTWALSVFPLWIGAAIWCVHRSTQGRSAQTAFAGAFAIATTAIVALEMLGGIPSSLSQGVLESAGVLGTFEITDVGDRYRQLLAAHGGLWIASLAGLVAGWKYREEVVPDVAEEPAA
jgi:hypothetical protein